MDLKITDSVHIKNQQIFHGKKMIFSVNTSGDINLFLKQAYKHMNVSYPKFHKMDGLSKLGILGTEVLFQYRDVHPETALVFSNSSSSLETDKIHFEAMDDIVSPAVFVYTLPNIVVGEISIKYGLQSENVFFVTEKLKAGLLVDYSEILFENSTVPAVVCAWIEWKNAEYDVFLSLISREGEVPFSKENLEELYHFENE